MSGVLVVETSIVVDLLARFRPEPIERLFWDHQAHLAAPELLDIEALHALRRLDFEGAIPSSRDRLVDQLAALPIRRYRHATLLPAIWKKRGQFTAYDAAYVALADALGGRLVTRDERVARANSTGGRVLVP